MRERTVEKALIREVEKRGGLCLKFVSPGRAGVPDRLCILPGGVVFFAELKAPGKILRPLQEAWRGILQQRGVAVAVIDSPEMAVSCVDSFSRRCGDTP